MEKEFKIYIFVYVILLIVVVVIACIQSYFEMNTFNKFSRTKASFADALFSDLKVIAN